MAELTERRLRPENSSVCDGECFSCSQKIFECSVCSAALCLMPYIILCITLSLCLSAPSPQSAVAELWSLQCIMATVWSTGGSRAEVSPQTLSSQSLAFENIRVFKTVMKPSLWWIGSHWRVCHLAWLTLPSLSPSLSACQESRWQRGPPGDRWLPVKLHLLPSMENPPQPAVFQDRHTAVTAKTSATRRGLSHKTSKASAAMKTQARGALSIFTALLLSDCSPPPLHTASTLFIHFSCRTVGDPKCAIYSAADMSKCLTYRIMPHITELSMKSFMIWKYVKSLCDE